jgi:hypothetical protein
MFDFWGKSFHSEPFAILSVYYCYNLNGVLGWFVLPAGVQKEVQPVVI